MARRRQRNVHEQLELGKPPPPARGGRRSGAGRPRKQGSPPRNIRRPELAKNTPVHVSLRVDPAVGRLRSRAGFRAIRRAVAACIGRFDFRIVHTSIQSNHLHLLVEANHKRSLANGVRAFMISAAQHLNRVRGRRGKVFTQRYHAVPVTSPMQARRALAYVLNNWRRHREDERGLAHAHVDPYSTGVLFDGWDGLREPRFAIPDGYEPMLVSGARSWLLTTGWRRHPLINVGETPGPLT